jgi:hypothetical protein
MSPKLLLACLCALVSCCLLPACQSSSKHPEQWRTEEIDVPTDRLLWEVTVFALEKEGYPTGTDLNPTNLEAVSGWRYSLAPFRGKGRRERAHIHFEALGPKRYRLQVRVERENNMDPVRPMDLSYADWKEAPDNTDASLILVQRIRSWIAPGLELKAPNAPKAPGGS